MQQIPALPQARGAAQALHDRLFAALNRATDPEDCAELDDALLAVDTILTQLNQEDLASRTGAMQAAAAEVSDAVEKLDALKDELAEIAQRVAVLGDVAGAVDSVIGPVKTIFGV